jgi:hypothetical protein
MSENQSIKILPEKASPLNFNYEDALGMRILAQQVMRAGIEGKVQSRDANAILGLMRVSVMSALAEVKISNDRKEKPCVRFLMSQPQK